MPKRPTPFTKARKRKYCDAMREGMTHRAAAAIAGVHRDTVLQHKSKGSNEYDPWFAAEVEKAEGESLAMFEEHARKRALEGWAREIVDKRGEVRTVVDAPDSKLLEILLRARDPKRYSTSARIEHSGQLTLSDAAEGELSAMSLEQLDKLVSMVERARQMMIDRDPAAKLEADKARQARIRELREALGKTDPMPTRPAAERIMHTTAELVVEVESERESETDEERAARLIAASLTAESGPE